MKHYKSMMCTRVLLPFGQDIFCALLRLAIIVILLIALVSTLAFAESFKADKVLDISYG